jgi:hypothetical protein
MGKLISLTEYLELTLRQEESGELITESLVRTRVRSNYRKLKSRDSLAQRVQDLKYVSELSPLERTYLKD